MYPNHMYMDMHGGTDGQKLPNGDCSDPSDYALQQDLIILNFHTYLPVSRELNVQISYSLIG